MEILCTDTVSPAFRCFEIAARKDATVTPEIVNTKASPEVGIHRPLPKIRKIASGSFFGFFKRKITKNKAGCAIACVLCPQSNYFVKTPNMIANPPPHCWRDAQGLMNPEPLSCNKCAPVTYPRTQGYGT
jgi:hypothetical protein